MSEASEVRPAEELLETRDGPVLTLTLNRPPANALSLALIARLRAALDRARADGTVRVIVIAAAGRLFSAGHDLREIRDHRAADADGGRAFLGRLFGDCSALMQAIVRHPRPVIAAVDGFASAAGCQLVASCDLALASENARFATPGVNIGGFCSTPMVALSRNVSRKHAMEMLLTGEPIDAGTALRIGLVNRVVGAGELAESLRELATRIAGKSPATIARGKNAFYAQADMALADAYAYATEVMVEDFLSRDAREGIDAFIEKRTPDWPGA